jgi:hypothetical protein
MTIFSHVLGTISNAFQVGIGGTGLRRIRFRNQFNGDLEWTPTANRTLVLPDVSGTILTSTDGFFSRLVFTSSSFVNIPEWANTMILEGWGGGAGGAGGGKRSAVAVAGGGGGAGGNYAYHIFTRDELLQLLANLTQILVSIGAGGTGGAGATVNGSNGNNGSVGNATNFEITNGTTFIGILRADGGGQNGGTVALGGTNVTGAAGTNSQTYQQSFIGGDGGSGGQATSGFPGVGPILGGSGGGGGGGIDGINVPNPGGASAFGSRRFPPIPGLNTAVGGGVSNSGFSGSSPISTISRAGTSGSGGGASASGNGGNGGNGGRACGGGGGGAARDSIGNGGNGGSGGNGYASIIFLR